MLTDNEFQAINQLHEIAKEHANAIDNLDGDIIEACNKIAGCLLSRAGGRDFTEKKREDDHANA